MDKNYDTYEYLPATGTESNQFFVVQDDGTYLSVNREIQYVTQVQDVKEVLDGVEPCTVYDIASQQFLIDVDNSTELISIPDQFILPDGESNIFPNNYLLPVTSTTEQQENQHNEVNQYEEPNTQVEDDEAQSKQQADSCTEITLSDDQYLTLKSKGWILLETNEKVFVLDTLGLHDITANDKLIQKLKSGDETSNEHIEEDGNISLSNQQDTVSFIIGEDGTKISKEISDFNEGHGNHLNSIEQAQYAEVLPSKSSPDISQQSDDSSHNEAVLVAAANDSLKYTPVNNTFKVKTDMFFKDIPDKVILGETENGNKLFAKITRIEQNIESSLKNNIKQNQRKQRSNIKNKIDEKTSFSNTSLNENLFQTLIRLTMQNSSEVKCTAEDIASADSIVTQLLKVPALKPSVLDRNIIITKEVSVQDATGTLNSGGLPSLVTGRVTSLDEGSYYFVHHPGLLERLINTSDSSLPPQKKGISQRKINLEDNNVLHIHVTEIKRADNVLRISITLNKRQLPNSINLLLDSKRKQPSKIFGCSACAAVFQTEEELKEHQEAQCMDVDDVLTIDIDKNVKDYTIENKGKDKIYSCNQCQEKFPKLYNCLKHLKTHFNSPNEIKDAIKTSRSDSGEHGGVYKCKMCPSIYFYPSTLSKHIVSKHIKVKPN
ncbi:uncharacterized protein [Battus philenor]|uniref:uncharacterized protein n=1 Tax=Battus philenor TaxID=42288 RepID=UPI0035D0B59F